MTKLHCIEFSVYSYDILKFKMAGRRKNVNKIVATRELLEIDDFSQEVWRIFTLYEELKVTELAISWCSRHKVIYNSRRCDSCGYHCTLNKAININDGVIWKCYTCKFSKNIRSDSVFENSNLNLRDTVFLIYFWSQEILQKVTAYELQLSTKTVSDWYNKFREICIQYLQNNPMQLGGMTEVNEPLVVEIDESLFFKRKYHKGRNTSASWVFGAIERRTGLCFLQKVPDRRRETLENLIKQWILPGTLIISDGWASYANIENIDGGIYQHEVILHQENFVDELYDDIHTQNIENLWMRMKMKIRRQYGTIKRLLSSYMGELMWRVRFNEGRAFNNFLVTLSSLL